MTPRSGTPYSLVAGASRAEITGTGGGIRSLSLGGVDVLDGFDIDHLAPGGAGQVLAPWPNRLADGKYSFDDVMGKVPINEPEKQNAIHGLVRWQEWTPTAHDDDASVTLETRLVAQPAYPWRVRITLTYRLSEDSFEVTFAAHNEDDRSAPFAIGFHPYFLADGGIVDHATIAVGATQRLRLDERSLPDGVEAVADTPFAAIAAPEGLALGGVVLDDCFTGIARAADGTAAASYRPGAGRRPVVVRFGPEFTHLMCFTGDTLAPPRHRRALALEPMTCAPNALATGEGIASIAPGATFNGTFSIAIG